MRKRILISLFFIKLPLIATSLIVMSVITMSVLAPSALAQRMISAPHFAAGFHRGGFNQAGFNVGFNRSPFSVGHTRSSLYSLPLYDSLYADFLSSTGYPVASQPPLIILQAPPAATPATDRSASPSQPQSQPLMIELQGDQYVRLSGPEFSGAEIIGPKTMGPAVDRKSASAAAVQTAPVPELRPAVLIFRDGHHEEASGYTIADGILYTSGDPYNGGPWNRKIQLSSLNLPETIASNQVRGLTFRVPQSPNEVIVRP